MEEFLLGIVDGGVNFNSLTQIILIYLAILWGMISLWVFFDSRKRFDNIFLPIGFFLATLLLNFPVLVLYIIVRPEHNEISEASTNLSIPVVDFVREDGSVEFSLKVNLIPVSGSSYILKTSTDSVEEKSVSKNVENEVMINQTGKRLLNKENLSTMIKKSRESSKNKFKNFKAKLPKRAIKSQDNNIKVEEVSKEI